MVLKLADIAAIAVIVGLIVSPVYILFGFLNRSYSSLRREVGELRIQVQQNKEATGEMKTEMERRFDRIEEILQEKRD